MSAAARADTRDEALGQGAEAATRSGPAERRPAVNTFDVFDTLIARRCIDPVGVFHAIAERSGLGNFVAARLAAERAVAHGPYDLATIYATLAEMFGLSGETAAELQAMEVEIEIENVIPRLRKHRRARRRRHSGLGHVSRRTGNPPAARCRGHRSQRAARRHDRRQAQGLDLASASRQVQLSLILDDAAIEQEAGLQLENAP